MKTWLYLKATFLRKMKEKEKRLQKGLRKGFKGKKVKTKKIFRNRPQKKTSKKMGEGGKRNLVFFFPSFLSPLSPVFLSPLTAPFAAFLENTTFCNTFWIRNWKRKFPQRTVCYNFWRNHSLQYMVYEFFKTFYEKSFFCIKSKVVLFR